MTRRCEQMMNFVLQTRNFVSKSHKNEELCIKNEELFIKTDESAGCSHDGVERRRLGAGAAAGASCSPRNGYQRSPAHVRFRCCLCTVFTCFVLFSLVLCLFSLLFCAVLRDPAAARSVSTALNGSQRLSTAPSSGAEMVELRAKVAICIENDEFCSKTMEFCIINDGFCIENDDFSMEMSKGRTPRASLGLIPLLATADAPADARYVFFCCLLCIYMPAIDRSLSAAYIHAGD